MRIRQIVFAATELKAGADRLGPLLGLATPYRDPGVAEFGLDNAVFAFGDQFIEIVSPVRDGTSAGRLLARRGDSGYMLILQTDHFERELARFDALGVRRVWAKDLSDIRATHLHPKDIGGAIVSIDQPLPAASWRWGGPDWAVQAGRAGQQRVVGVTVGAHGTRRDPAPGAGRRLGRLRGRRRARRGHHRLHAGGGRPRRSARPRARAGTAGRLPLRAALRHPHRAARTLE